MEKKNMGTGMSLLMTNLGELIGINGTITIVIGIFFYVTCIECTNNKLGTFYERIH